MTRSKSRISNQIRTLRFHHAEMTQQDLATESGVGQPVISRLERGRCKNMTLRTMQRLATALQMTLGEIEWEQSDAKV